MTDITDKIAAWPPKPPIRVQYKSDKEPYRSNALLDIVMQQRDRAIAERDLALEVLRREVENCAGCSGQGDYVDSEGLWSGCSVCADARAVLAACGKEE